MLRVATALVDALLAAAFSTRMRRFGIPGAHPLEDLRNWFR